MATDDEQSKKVGGIKISDVDLNLRLTVDTGNLKRLKGEIRNTNKNMRTEELFGQ